MQQYDIENSSLAKVSEKVFFPIIFPTGFSEISNKIDDVMLLSATNGQKITNIPNEQTKKLFSRRFVSYAF